MTARVLAVDDVPANLRLMEARLRAEHCQVALATSGAQALALAAEWQPDIVLLDVAMPGMDGFETCSRLKAMPATTHVPVVMVTALVEPAARVRGLEAGADDFLSKPVDETTLLARLRALLRVKQVLDAWRLRADAARDLGLDPPSNPPVDAAGSRVLLLGQRDEATACLSRLLTEDGVLVDRVSTQQEGWDRLSSGAHDLVVLDLLHRGGDGLRFVSRLRAQAATRDVPVLLVAGTEQRDLVLRAFDLGASDHVLRPVDPSELRARLRNQIRRVRYQARLREELDRSLARW